MFEVILLAIGCYLVGQATSAEIGWGVFLIAFVMGPNEGNARAVIKQLTSIQKSLDEMRSKSNQ